ncbi:hypothetical protein JXB11_01855 [Candidatus Woesearchaeota archaeon]|nr:hypothetical protein [Candidatus Woesearchaeota archaeon]
MDGFIRVLQKNNPSVHELWQIWFPEKVLVEFEKGKCRVVPSQYVDGQLTGFRLDYKKLLHAEKESLDLLIEAAATGQHQKEVHEILDSLHSKFSELLIIYEKRFVQA